MVCTCGETAGYKQEKGVESFMHDGCFRMDEFLLSVGKPDIEFHELEEKCDSTNIEECFKVCHEICDDSTKCHYEEQNV